MSTTTPDFETLALERVDEHVTVIRLNRPEASNALNTQMGPISCTASRTSRSMPGACAASF
jgi:hypothetical protein